MNIKNYRDKVYGCWLGKNIGGTIGAPMEGTKEFVHLPEKYPEEAVANDDLDLQLVWLDVLEKKNGKITVDDLADGWRNCITYPFDEYGVALANLKLGLKPPYTGIYNNYFKNCMGSPIRSEIWACIAPGEPERAGWYAYLDAQVDHWDEGVYGEIFFSCLESLAFENGNIKELLSGALEYLPACSKINNVVARACEYYDKGLSLTDARQNILKEFEDENFTHCVQNIGFTALGLLYGEGKFLPSILRAIECGYDTDCTGATAGAIIGIILGGKVILEGCNMEIDERVIAGSGICNIKAPANLKELTDRTIAMAELLANQPEQPKISKPFTLPEIQEAASPLNYPFIIGDNAEQIKKQLQEKSYTTEDVQHFNNSYFDLMPFDNGKPITLGTRFNLTSERILFFYPVCKSGIALSIDGKQMFDSKGPQPFIPAPHRPNSPEAEVNLAPGEHTIMATIEHGINEKKLGWIVSDKQRHLVVDIDYNLS